MLTGRYVNVISDTSKLSWNCKKEAKSRRLVSTNLDMANGDLHAGRSRGPGDQRRQAVGLGADVERPPAREVRVGGSDRYRQRESVRLERPCPARFRVTTRQRFTETSDRRRLEERVIELTRRPRPFPPDDTDADRRG